MVYLSGSELAGQDRRKLSPMMDPKNHGQRTACTIRRRYPGLREHAHAAERLKGIGGISRDQQRNTAKQGRISWYNAHRLPQFINHGC